MKTLKLTNCDKYVMVDDDDFEELSKYKWHLANSTKSKAAGNIIDQFCVRGWVNNRSRTLTYIHRFIMNAGRGQIIDHIDGNCLNAQKSNLRFATKSQNAINRINRPSNAKTTYSGITFVQGGSKKCPNYKRKRPWLSRIKIAGKVYHGSYHSSEIMAALSADRLKHKHHGEFASYAFKDALFYYLNFAKDFLTYCESAPTPFEMGMLNRS